MTAWGFRAGTVTRSTDGERGRQLALVPADRISQIRHVQRVREGGLGKGKRGGPAALPLTPALSGNEVLGPVAEDQLVVAPASFLRACSAQFRTDGLFERGRKGGYC